MTTIPTFSTFETLFAPANQDKCAINVEKTLTAPSPTLIAISDAYGMESAMAWVSDQLTPLANYSGAQAGDVVVTQQMLSLARVLITNYPNLRATDLMLFLSRFKAGCYERFYGSFDPMVVTTSLNRFIEWSRQMRGEIQVKLDRERRRKEMDEYYSRTDLLTREEWLAMRKEKGTSNH